MRRGIWVAGCVFMLLSWPLLANDLAATTDARAIVAQQQQLKADAEARVGRFADMPAVKRNDLLARQDKVFALLDGRESSTELSQQQQLSLLNELEAIGALVNNTEDERMICERVKPMGSNRPVKVCKTVAQRRAEREGAEDQFGRRNQQCSGSCESSQNAW